MPTAQLDDLNSERYKIFPIEPLHDIKGHLLNMIEEAIAIAEGEALTKLTNIKNDVLSKDTLRCSDYRKVVIMMYMALDKINSTSSMTEQFQTAVEINEILYAKPDKRNRVQTPWLHNVAFLHGLLCRDLFASPVHVIRARMFGRYYHPVI